MTVAADISGLGADHHWDFDGDSLDQIGSVNGTDTSILYTSAAIAEDATNCAETNAVADRVSIPTTTEINNSAQARKAVCGWYAATAIQNPPKNIYGEGDATQAFRFILGWGNYVVFEVDSANFTLQIFGDVALAVNRPYHLCMVFENSTYGNELRAYLDGIEQLNAEPTNRQPGANTLPARSVAEFGDPAGTVAVGGTAVILIAPINGKWNHWATWGDEADAVLTDSEVRVTLFERGALAEDTVSTDTEANMQIAMDALTVSRPDECLGVEVAAVTGAGDFEITSDLVFDDLTSMHVRYNGSADTLRIVNVSGGNATDAKCGAPYGGVIEVATRQTLTITVKDLDTGAAVVGARCYIKADTGGDLAVGTEIMNDTTNGSGIATVTHDYTSDQPIIGWIRKGSASPLYKEGIISGPLTSTALNQTVLMVSDE